MPDPRFTHDAITCAWLLGGHQWKPLARYDWQAQSTRVSEERCTRCGLRRPLGGLLASIARSIANGNIRAEYTLIR